MVIKKRDIVYESADRLYELRKAHDVLSQCASPYLVRYYGCYVLRSSHELWSVCEYMTAGCVTDFVRDHLYTFT